MFKKKVKLSLVLVLTMLATMLGGLSSVSANGVYNVLDVPAVSSGDGKSLGTISAVIEAGSLSSGSVLDISLPEGFRFPNAIDVTNAIYDTTPQNNADSVEFFAPPQMSGGINVLNQIATPGLTITASKVSENEIAFSLSTTPGVANQGYFIIYLNGIYVPSNFDTEVALNISSNSGFGMSQPVVAENGSVAPSSVDNQTTPIVQKNTAVFVIGSDTYRLNSIEYNMGVAPYIKEGRTFLPVRYVASALGISESNILWDGSQQTVTLKKDSKTIVLQIASQTMQVDGQSVALDAAPEITNERTCLPIAPIAEVLGATVSWDGDTRTATIAW